MIFANYMKIYNQKTTKCCTFALPKWRLQSDSSTSCDWKSGKCLFCERKADEKHEKQRNKALRRKIHHVIIPKFTETIWNFVKEQKDCSFR